MRFLIFLGKIVGFFSALIVNWTMDLIYLFSPRLYSVLVLKIMRWLEDEDQSDD
tara:strand:+ start:202 stop:363 length:162 start_codon:yes stop_codon:yes gene_type:complete